METPANNRSPHIRRRAAAAAHGARSRLEALLEGAVRAERAAHRAERRAHESLANARRLIRAIDDALARRAAVAPRRP